MSSTSEGRSGQQHDKAQRVKWPHLQRHWQTQHAEAQHRTMKKSEGSRNHSWWWDSHISPKNSKWLQENLSEMDSKVTAMLKIIEEDADSFSKRAEMYYKRRPELVNLVEEFYRTYRALVEQHTFLTRELRQNVAPALQAQLGVTADSAPNSPLDTHLKHGVDGIDIISPSYSYPGGSEYDDSSPSAVSYTSWKAPMDEEEYSPQDIGSNFDIQLLNSKSKFISSEEETFYKVHELGGLPNAVDGDIRKLQKDLRHLQEENRALSAKALGDVTNLKNLHLELSNLQSKMRTMEAEDKLAKNRLMSVLELEQKLEAENLKLSHALITAKEEKTGLDDLRKREMEESDTRCRRIQELEKEAVSLKEEISRAQSQALVGLEQVKKLEKENEQLQQAVTSARETRERDSIDQKQAFEVLLQELQERFSLLEKDNIMLKEHIAMGSADTKRLEDQVMELVNAKKDLAQELHDLQKQNKALEQEKHRADLRSQNLQWELDVARRNGQSLSEQMLQKTAQIENLQKAICELQAESNRLAIQKMEGCKLVIKLEADIQELLRDKNRLISECQQYESTCNAYEMMESQFKDQLASKFSEYAVLQDQKLAIEATFSKAEVQVKELQESLSTLYSEKEKLLHELEEASEQVKTMEIHCTQTQKEVEDSQGCNYKLKQDLAECTTHITDLEGTLSCLLEDIHASEKREAAARQAILELQENSRELCDQLGAKCAASKQLKDQISGLQEERTALVLDIQQAQQSLVTLQGERAALSNHYERTRADHRAAMEEVRKGQEDLSLYLCNLKELQDQHSAKVELIHKMENEIETLKKQLTKSDEQTKIMGNENEKHLKKLADVQGRICVLMAAHSDSLTENAALANQILDKARVIEVHEARISDLERERSNLVEEVAMKSKNTLLLQAQLLASEQQAKSHQIELQNGADVIQRLEAEAKRVQEAVSKAEEDNKTLVEDQQRNLHENFSLRKKIKDLQEELSHVTLERAALVGEVANSTEQCRDLDLRIQNLKVDKDAVQKELSAVVLLENQLKEEVINLHMENKQLSCKLDSEHEKMQQQQEHIQKLQKTLGSSQENCTVMQGKLNVAFEEKDVLERKCADLQSEMHTQLLASQKQEESLHGQLQKGGDVIRSLEAELKRLQQAVSKAEGDHKTVIQEQQRSMDESFLMERKIKDLQKELSHLTQENIGLVGEVTASTKQCKDLELRIHSLEGDKDAEIRKVQKQEENLQQLQQTLKSSQEQLMATQDRLNVTSEEKSSLERKCRDLQLKMQAQLLASQSQEESLHTQLEKGADVIRSLEAELRRLQEAVSKAEGDHKTMVQERQRSMDESFLMGKNIKDLQEQLSNLTQEKVALVGEFTASTKHCKGLELRIQSLEAEKDAEMRKVQKQEENLRKLQETLKSVQGEFKAIQDKLNVASEEKDVLERKCVDLQTEMHTQLLASQKQEESLCAQLQNGADVIQGLEADLERLHALVFNAERDHKTMVQERQRSINESFLMEKKIKDLQEELSHLMHEKFALLGEVTSSTNNCKDLELRIQSLEVEKEAETRKVQRQEEDLQMLQQTLTSSQEEFKVIQDKLDVASEDKNVLEGKCSDLQLEMHAKLLASQKQEELLHSQLQKGTHVIQCLEAELTRLQQAVSKAEGDHKTMVQERQRSIDEGFFMEKKIKDLQEELSCLTQEKVALVGEVTASTKHCKDLELRIQSLEVEKDAEMRKVQKQEEDLHDLCGTLKSSQEEFVAIQDKLNVASEEKGVLERKCADLHTQLLASHKQEESLHTQLRKGADVIQSLEAELQRLQQAVLKAEGDHKSMLQEHQRSMDESFFTEKKIKDLQEELSRLTQEKVVLVGEVTASTKHCKNLALRNQSLEVDKGAEMRKVQKQEEDLQELQRILKSSQEESIAIQDKLNVASEERDVLKRKQGELQSEMHTQLLASQKQEESFHAQMQTSVDAIRSLQAELKRLQQAVSKAEGDHKTTVQERQRSVDQNFMMEKKIRDLQAELSQVTQAKVALVEENAASAEQCKDLQVRIQTLEGDKDVVEEELLAVAILEKQLRGEVRKLREENKLLSGSLDAELAKVQKQQENLQELQQVLTSLQDEFKGIQDKLNVASEEKFILERKCGDLQSELQAQLRASQKQEESLHAQLQKGDNLIRSLEAEVKRLQEAVSKAEGDHKTVVQRSMDESFVMEKKIKDLQEELSHLKQEKAGLVMEVTTTGEQCKHLEGRIDGLQVDKDALEKELAAVVLSANQLKEDVRKAQEESKQLFGALGNEIKKVQKQEEDLQQQQQTLRSAQDEKNLLQDKMKVAIEEKDDVERKCSGLKEELKESKGAALAATDRVGQLEAKVVGLQQALAVAEANLSTKVKVISTLQEDSLILQNEKQDLEQKLQLGVKHMKVLEEEIERLRQALTDVQRGCEGLEEQSRMNGKEIEALRGSLKDGTDEVNKLKIEVQRLQQQSHKASQRCSILQSEKVELDDAMESLETRLKHLEVVIDGLENTKQTLLMELQQYDKHGMLMMLDIKDLRRALDNRIKTSAASRRVPVDNTRARVPDEPLLEERQEEVQRIQAERALGGVEVPNECETVQTTLPKLLDLQDNGTAFKDERESFAQESAVAARKHEISELKKEIRVVLEENDALRSESLAAWMEHHVMGVRVKELKEKLSSQEHENTRLSSEVHSFKTEVNRLEEETTFLKRENVVLHEKVLAADVEVRKVQCILSTLQVEGRRFVISLKVILFSLQEEIVTLTEEWQSSNGKAEGIHVVCRIDQENTSDIGVYEEGMTRTEDKAVQQGQEDTTSRENESPQDWTVEVVLAQLQARVEEADKVKAAVKILRQVAANFFLVLPVKKPADESHETVSVEEKRVQAMPSTERSRLSLGARLHDEKTDEEMEKLLGEMKEGRKQLREEVRARTEQVRRVQAELEKMELGKEEVDEKRQKVARKLAEKVEVQRQRLEAAIVEETAAERLEEEVLILMAKDEWDEEEAERIRREIGKVVQQKRNEAQELQSVEEELKRVSLRIQNASHEQQDDDAKSSGISSSSSSGVSDSRRRSRLKKSNSGRKASRFSLPWAALSPQRRRSGDSPGHLPRRRSADVASNPGYLAPIRGTSSNTTLLLQDLRDKAKCWACVSAPRGFVHD